MHSKNIIITLNKCLLISTNEQMSLNKGPPNIQNMFCIILPNVALGNISFYMVFGRAQVWHTITHRVVMMHNIVHK